LSVLKTSVAGKRLLASLLAVGLAMVFMMASSWTDHWRDQVVESSAGRPGRTVFELDATGAVEGWLFKKVPTLTVGCETGADLTFSVVTGMDTTVEPGTARTVRVQFDSDKSEVTKWNQGATHRVLSAPPERAAQLAERLSRATRFRFAFVPFNAEPSTVTFAVRGFTERWRTLQQRCAISVGTP
jgi:hypothetical protein